MHRKKCRDSFSGSMVTSLHWPCFPSWLQNGCCSSCHLIYVHGRKQETGRKAVSSVACLIFLKEKNLRKHFPEVPQQMSTHIQCTRTDRLGHACLWWGWETICVWLSSPCSGKQQRPMILRMALGQLIYSDFCDGSSRYTWSQEFGKVRGVGNSWRD